MQNILFDGPVGQQEANFLIISDAAISGLKTDVSGDDPCCGAGGCQKVVLTERQALVMPARMLHMVETHSESVVLGVNFIHCGHLLTAGRVFRHSCLRNDNKRLLWPTISERLHIR